MILFVISAITLWKNGLCISIAQAAHLLGAEVTLISGDSKLDPPRYHRFIKVQTSGEIQNAVQKEIDGQDIFICVAAISDYTVATVSQQKIKRGIGTLTLELIPTTDILATVCSQLKKPFTVGFAAETENTVENPKQKCLRKGVDLIVVNDVSQTDIGFGSNNNAVTVICENEIVHLEKNSKRIIAHKLLKIIAKQYNQNRF